MMAWPGDESETNGTEQGARRRPHLQITWIMVLHRTVEKAKVQRKTIHKEDISNAQRTDVSFFTVASGGTYFDLNL